jgi:XTP/dITP diphosphohydrolase
LVLATANPHKVEEIAAILGDQVQLLPRPVEAGEVDENGETLVENARLKARALVEVTGLPAVADDTGLEVAALGGAPGVYSARYAGEAATYADNVAKLLHALTGVDGREARAATFRTVAVVAWPDGTETQADGALEGWIASEAQGSGGFGYDPVFVPAEGDGRTLAELEPDEKNRVSHRGRAFRVLAAKLRTRE